MPIPNFDLNPSESGEEGPQGDGEGEGEKERPKKRKRPDLDEDLDEGDWNPEREKKRLRKLGVPEDELDIHTEGVVRPLSC